jgi:hypothetical protein
VSSAPALCSSTRSPELCVGRVAGPDHDASVAAVCGRSGRTPAQRTTHEIITPVACAAAPLDTRNDPVQIPRGGSDVFAEVLSV